MENSKSVNKSPVIRTAWKDIEITILFDERPSDKQSEQNNIKKVVTNILTNAYESRITSKI